MRFPYRIVEELGGAGMGVVYKAEDTRLWISDIDGKNQLKLFATEELGTGFWSTDNTQISFVDNTGGVGRSFLVRTDGCNLRQIQRIEGSVAE